MNRVSDSLLANDPLTWDLQYWLDIHIIGSLLGEEVSLMAYRIDIELSKYRDRAFLDRFKSVWTQYQIENRAERMGYWTRMTQNSKEAKPYIRDIEAMLVNKGQKARDYLRVVQTVMIEELRKPNLESARRLFDEIAEIYQKLQEEEAADAEHLPPVSQTPLGAPINQASAMLLAKDPLAWNLQYWLDLGLIGNLRGEDIMLMGLRIEIEYSKTLDPALRIQFQNAWIKYQIRNRAERVRYWSQMTLDSEDAKPYLRDLNTMLVDKGRKTRDYLRSAETAMSQEQENLNFGRAQVIFDRLARIYPKLRQEEAGNAGAGGRSQNLIDLD